MSQDDAVADSFAWRLASEDFVCRSFTCASASSGWAEDAGNRCVLLDPGIDAHWLVRQLAILAASEPRPALVFMLEPAADELLHLLASPHFALRGLALPFSLKDFEQALGQVASDGRRPVRESPIAWPSAARAAA
ncbi:hypothetical protein [Niveibacterium sp. SC-1]|uniref:hypothetical protein n=1 Tax=Niveibacterium sp. SC-1 TaxID=3135646 RepID=UPI0031205091